MIALVLVRLLGARLVAGLALVLLLVSTRRIVLPSALFLAAFQTRWRLALQTRPFLQRSALLHEFGSKLFFRFALPAIRADEFPVAPSTQPCGHIGFLQPRFCEGYRVSVEIALTAPIPWITDPFISSTHW